MWHYYFGLSLRSLKRTPLLIILVIVTLAVGVGALSANLTLLQTMAADPLPHKSDRVLHISMNTWPNTDTHRQPFHVLRYRDAQAIWESGHAEHVAVGFKSGVYVNNVGGALQDRQAASVRVTTPGFFAISETPFAFGQAFESTEGYNIVIGHELNQKLFNGQNSVGKALEIEGKSYTIVGVLKPWLMRPKFYQIDHYHGPFGDTEDLFVPLETAIDNNWQVHGWMSSIDYEGDVTKLSTTRPHNVFYLSAWVQVASEAKRDALQTSLDNYSQNLKDGGEHPNDIMNHLDDISAYATKNKVVDKRVIAFSWASALFLLVCIFNASSLLLAKYHGDTGEINLRSALGANRGHIFRQGLIDALLVGLLSAVLALILSWLFLQLSLELIPALREFVTLAPSSIIQAIVIAVVTALFATGYPLWRASQSTITNALK